MQQVFCFTETLVFTGAHDVRHGDCCELVKTLLTRMKFGVYA